MFHLVILSLFHSVILVFICFPVQSFCHSAILRAIPQVVHQLIERKQAEIRKVHPGLTCFSDTCRKIAIKDIPGICKISLTNVIFYCCFVVVCCCVFCLLLFIVLPFSSGDGMETNGDRPKVSGCGFIMLKNDFFFLYRTPREMELDMDFDKLTAVLTRMLHQVKVCMCEGVCWGGGGVREWGWYM